VNKLPAEHKAFLLYYADVCETESARRSGDFAEWITSCAIKARTEADAIDVSPRQADLFAPQPQRAAQAPHTHENTTMASHGAEMRGMEAGNGRQT